MAKVGTGTIVAGVGAVAVVVLLIWLVTRSSSQEPRASSNSADVGVAVAGGLTAIGTSIIDAVSGKDRNGNGDPVEEGSA